MCAVRSWELADTINLPAKQAECEYISQDCKQSVTRKGLARKETHIEMECKEKYTRKQCARNETHEFGPQGMRMQRKRNTKADCNEGQARNKMQGRRNTNMNCKSKET